MLNKKFKIIYIPLVLLIILCSLTVGITDYITAGFSFSVFKTAHFWTNILCTNVGTICLIVSILLIRNDNFKDINEDYKSSSNNIYKFYRENYIAPVFKKFCFDDNQKTKIIFYKNSINKKISKLKPTKEDLYIYYNGTEEQKENNKYCSTLEYYNMLLSKDYIDSIINKINIKYPSISDSLIFIGLSNDKNLVDYVTVHKAKKVFIDLLPKYLISFCVVSFTSGLIIDFNSGINFSCIIKTIIKLFSIFSQIFFAYNYSNKYNIEVTLHDVHFRESKLNEYKIWENYQLSKKGESNNE